MVNLFFCAGQCFFVMLLLCGCTTLLKCQPNWKGRWMAFWLLLINDTFDQSTMWSISSLMSLPAFLKFKCHRNLRSLSICLSHTRLCFLQSTSRLKLAEPEVTDILCRWDGVNMNKDRLLSSLLQIWIVSLSWNLFKNAKLPPGGIWDVLLLSLQWSLC